MIDHVLGAVLGVLLFALLLSIPSRPRPPRGPAGCRRRPTSVRVLRPPFDQDRERAA